MPTPQRVIDSHIHLWPSSASNEDGHAWMVPGMPLAKQHILSDYHNASNVQHQPKPQQPASELEGVVYIETDRRYDASHGGSLETWAKGPLEEVAFVRSIIEGDYDARDSELLLGIVLWAPLDQSPEILESWLRLAESTAGPKTWSRVKGFRFLLQAILDRHAFEALVLGEDFLTNLQLLGRRGFAFDLGVDQRSGGDWQLELAARMMRRAHEGVEEEGQRVRFVVNHLCKPDFSCGAEGGNAEQGVKEASFGRWCRAIESMAACENARMKLSGAFSELNPELSSGVAEMAARIRPWVTHVLNCFGSSRVMYGSDWPVCNLKGPLGEGSRVAWQEVVDALLADERLGLNAEDRESIWRRTVREAYRLN